MTDLEEWNGPAAEQFVVTQNGVERPQGSPSASHLAGLWAQLRVPDSPTRRRWDLLIYVLVLYTVFYFPFSSAFAAAFPLPVLASDFAVDFMFVLDMLLNSRSFFYLYSGDLCTERLQVRHHYLTGWLFVDLVGTIPAVIEVVLLLVLSSNSNGGASSAPGGGGGGVPQAFRLVRLLRLAQISKLLRFEKRHYTYLPGLRHV